jgi:excisionase family DNA binding protein
MEPPRVPKEQPRLDREHPALLDEISRQTAQTTLGVPGVDRRFSAPMVEVLQQPPLLVKIEQGAQLLGISRSKMYQLVAEARIRAVHIDRSARLSVQSLVDFCESLEREAK